MTIILFDLTLRLHMRCMWRIATEYNNEAHFAMYQNKLVETSILASFAM